MSWRRPRPPDSTAKRSGSREACARLAIGRHRFWNVTSLVVTCRGRHEARPSGVVVASWEK